jgi:hypothetical protein
MPVNSKGQKYTISDNGKNRLHTYGTPGKKGVRFASKDYRVVKMARPKGYTYDPTNTQYYKTTESDGGLTSTRTYRDGHTVNSAGSAWKKSGLPASDYQQALNTWNITNQPTIDKLTLNKGRESQAQNKAYGTIAGYYAGLQGQTQNLMNQVGQVGQATDAQVKAIGADRNAQIQQATPQYGGPLGMVAQQMANTEQQAALNRGAGVDAANRTYGAQTSGSRQALIGQMGAGQAVAGQERLSLLKGQGNQALQSYTDKINEIEGQKGSKVLDTARQLGYDRQALGIKQSAATAAATKAAADLYRAQHPAAPKSSGGKSGSNKGTTTPKSPATKKPNSSPYGASAEANRSFQQKAGAGVELFKQAGINKKDVDALDNFYQFLVTQKHYSPVEAAVARSVYATNGLTPFAAKTMHQAGYASNGMWKMTSKLR